MTRVTLYTRPGCHLCEHAEAGIERVRREVAFDFEAVDIESDDALLRRFLERIPVVAVDGTEVFELDEFDEAGFRNRLARVQGG